MLIPPPKLTPDHNPRDFKGMALAIISYQAGVVTPAEVAEIPMHRNKEINASDGDFRAKAPTANPASNQGPRSPKPETHMMKGFLRRSPSA